MQLWYCIQLIYEEAIAEADAEFVRNVNKRISQLQSDLPHTTLFVRQRVNASKSSHQQQTTK